MIRSFILSLLLLSSPLYAESGSCTGFFVSSQGYLATAAHCAVGTKYTGVYKIMGKWIREPLNITYIDKVHDIMIMQAPNLPNEVFSLALPIIGEKVTCYGWPIPEYLGYNLKHTHGKILDLNSDLVAYNALSGFGNSGGPVVDENGSAVAIVHMGMFGFGELQTLDNEGENVKYLMTDMQLNNIPMEVNTSKDIESKMVFILIED